MTQTRRRCEACAPSSPSGRVADREVPNLGLLLSRRGRIVLDAAVGEASVGRPLSSDSILRLYSMSKPLTAAGALILVEQGKLSLEGKVSDFQRLGRRQGDRHRRHRWRASKRA